MTDTPFTRIVVAGSGSIVGQYPAGNTGRTTMALTEVAEVLLIWTRFSPRATLDRRGEQVLSPTVPCHSAARRNDHRVLT